MFFTARFAQDAENAELEIFSFAVERTAKEKQSTLIEIPLDVITSNNFFSSSDSSFLLSAPCPPSRAAQARRAGLSGKKKNDSLRTLRLCGENDTSYVIVFKNMCTK
jgi:hypothetical protein